MEMVFLVYGFDSMDGSMGREYVHAVYRQQADAVFLRDALNGTAQTAYERQARVVPMQLRPVFADSDARRQ